VQREELINGVRDALAKAGFTVSRPLNLRNIAFDMAARRDDSLLLVKVLSNVDAFSKESADEMKTLCEALSASPLLVGERSSSGEVEQGIVYSRFNVPIVSLATLQDLLIEKVPPFIYAAPGGLYVKLDSELLRRLRDERGISLGTLAEMAGVSRRTIQMYEGGMGAMVDVALRLEEFLDSEIVMPLDPLTHKVEKTEQKPLDIAKYDDEFTREVFHALSGMGFSIRPTQRAPFDALTSRSEVIILTSLGKDEVRIKEKARMIGDISKITGRESVIIVERAKSRHALEGTPLVSREELRKLDGSKELRDLVASRSDTDAEE
jgi:putative transcriptional regulator